MLAGILLIAFGLGIFGTLCLFYWALCRAAALGDMPLPDDSFAAYRRHLATCRTCDPPKTWCEQGEWLRQWSINKFLERGNDAQKVQGQATADETR